MNTRVNQNIAQLVFSPLSTLWKVTCVAEEALINCIGCATSFAAGAQKAQRSPY